MGDVGDSLRVMLKKSIDTSAAWSSANAIDSYASCRVAIASISSKGVELVRARGSIGFSCGATLPSLSGGNCSRRCTTSLLIIIELFPFFEFCMLKNFFWSSGIVSSGRGSQFPPNLSPSP
jgi:hypothetical protein